MPVLDMTLARDGKHCFWFSSVGRKFVMAVTGFAFILFVTAHMIGNLTSYFGFWDNGHAMNEYAAFLHGFVHGGAIWVVRAVLLAFVCLHALAALSLTWDNWKARKWWTKEDYKMHKLRAASWASRTMRYTACILCLFVLFHLLHLTLGWSVIDPEFQDKVHDIATGAVTVHAYENFVRGFQNPYYCGIYIIAILCLGLHIWHGVWSFSQTLGLAHPRYDACRRYLATAWALAVTAVNLSFPITFYFKDVVQGFVDSYLK
jgi:succinate dehydrogenase / fumarate reductase cytochrome b subunit